MVEIVPLCSEPDDEAYVANYAQNTKQILGGEVSSREMKKGEKLARKLRVRTEVISLDIS